MRRRTLAYVLTLALIFTLIPMGMTAALQETEKQNWTITGSETIADQIIVVKGKLVLKSGGSLTLRNSTLLIEGSEGILAEKGSQFLVETSKIRSNNPGKSFYPILIKNDNAKISNSEITGLGSTPPGCFNPLAVEGSSFTLSGCTVGGAMSLQSNHDCIIEGNKFYQESTPSQFSDLLRMEISNNNRIVKNLFYGGLNSVQASYSCNNTFDSNIWFAQQEKNIGKDSNQWWNETYVNNSVSGNSICLNKMSNNNIITNNQAYGPSCTGFRILQSGGNLFKGNTVKGTRVGLVLNFAYDNIIDGNKFSDIWEHESIQIYRSNDNHIINNDSSNAEVGLGLMYSKNNILSGNKTDNCGMGLRISGSNANRISGNSVAKSLISLIVEDSAGNKVTANNFSDGRIKSDVCKGNTISGNFWSGGMAAEDSKADASPAKSANPVVTVPQPDVKQAQNPVFRVDTINIDQDTIWENKEIVLNGIINIKKGVSLTMKNVTLVYKPGSTCYFNAEDASLLIYNSKLTGQEYGCDFNIKFRKCRDFVLKDSTMSYMNSWDGCAALTLDNVKNVDIQNNTFQSCYQSVYLDNCATVTFSNNKIEKCYTGLALLPAAGSTVKIQNNRIDQAMYHGMRLWGLPGKLSAASVISGNTVTNSRGMGIWDGISYTGIDLSGNSFENVKGPAIMTNKNINIDARAFQPVSATSSRVKKGETIKVYFAATGVRRKIFDGLTNSHGDLKLTLNGKVISAQGIKLRAGQMSMVELSAKAPEDGVWGLIFEKEQLMQPK